MRKDEQHFQPGENPGHLGDGDCGDDIAMRAADSLIRKWNAVDKDAIIIDMAEVINNLYEQGKCESVKMLRAHMDGNIVITDTWVRAEDLRELEESELRDGEISARTFTVGCFLIRQATCLYQGKNCFNQEEGRIPAERSIVSEYKKRYLVGKRTNLDYTYNEEIIFSLPELSDEYRKAREISAKYIGKSGISSDEWQHICYVDVSVAWNEDIRFICAVKSGASVPDSQASLFVRKEYVGSSFRVDDWYRLAPSGIVKEYRLHQLDTTCHDTLWEL